MTRPRSLTTWARLEPQTRNEALTGGLEARVADPLWLLGRQWQVGEFQGEDAGSPAITEIEGESNRLARFQPGDETAVKYDPSSAPLEVLVERERVRPTDERIDQSRPRDLRAAAQAGLHFHRLLTEAGLDHDIMAFQEPLRLSWPAETLDDESQRFATITAGRVLDGDQLYITLRDLDANADVGLVLFGEPVSDDKPYQDAAKHYLDWYRNLYDEPDEESATWNPDRLEYNFKVAALTDDEEKQDEQGDVGLDEIVLTASEYTGGRLDWDDFSVKGSRSVEDDIGIPSEERDPMVISEKVLPTYVDFPGMPAPRWWEFEDANIDLHQFDIDAVDLSRLVFTEFVLLSGNDWFITPIEVPIGSLTRLETVAVTDTFGERTTIEPTEEFGSGNWSVFRFKNEDHNPGLFVAPVLADKLETDPVESVLFSRDEMANIAWAVEQTVESRTGHPLDRFEAASKMSPEETSTPSTEGTLTYELATDVPEYWFPLVPEATEDGSIRLVRGGLLSPDEYTANQPIGRVLNPEGALALYDEEVPRAGIEVTRSYQLARWVSGSTHLWCGHRKRPGSGGASSGLRFDQAREHDDSL